MEEEKLSERIKESSVVGAEEVGDEEDADDLVFPGFRFHPTDQELVGFYLARKVEKKGFSIDIIKEIDIYKHDPWDLPNEARHGVLQVGASGDNKDRYFFCLRGRKYRNSIRPNRVTGSGFWKATGIDKPIHGGGGAGECLGLKKSLVYYRGSAGRGTKTDWMMHEFRLPSTPSSAEELQDAGIWTICRIFKRNMSYSRRCQQQQQKQQHGGSKRSHQQKQQQLESYYDYHYLHQQKQQQLQYYYDYQYLHQHRASMAMTSSYDSSGLNKQACAATDTNHQPFLLHGFHGVPSAVTSTAATSGLMGAPNLLPSTTSSGWSELTTFRQSASTCWDELGRIMEI